MKTNGATWKAYLASWPKGQWYDDSDETYDGRPGNECEGDPAPTSVVEFSCGVVYRSRSDEKGISLSGHFRAWLKAQTHTTVVCSIPKDSLEAFTAFVKSMKVSVAA